MKQLVGLARALAVEPELLCMDEPFSALDVLTARTMRDLVLDLWASPEVTTKSILLVTHSIEEAVTLSDRVVVLKANPGRIADIGRPARPPAAAPRGRARRPRDGGPHVRRCSRERRKAGPRVTWEPLPHAPIGMVLGLLEHLREAPGGRRTSTSSAARSATSSTTSCPSPRRPSGSAWSRSRPATSS